jgi:hypothetical protein
LLACKAENEILLYNYTSTEHVSHSSSFVSALHADQEHKIVKPAVVFPSSQEELIADPYDSEDLWDNNSHVLRPQLVNEHVTSDIEPNILAKKEHVICIANETEEINLLSSLNTWGYIEFDDLFELDSLENILFARSTIPCPSHAIFYFAGKYNNIGQFLVDRIYISSRYVISSLCANKILACPQEEKKLLFPCTLVEVSGLYLKDLDKSLVMNINHDAKPRTVCCQEGENDENITRMDMTILMAPATKTLRNKEVDWGPSNDISNISNQATTSSDLKVYLGEEHTLESRTILLQEGEDDDDITAINTTTPATPSPFNHGPVKRVHACKFNYQVNSFLVVEANHSLNEVLKPCDYFIMLRCLRRQQGNKSCSTREDFETTTSASLRGHIFQLPRSFNANKYLLESSLRLIAGGSRINGRLHPRRLGTTERTS